MTRSRIARHGAILLAIIFTAIFSTSASAQLAAIRSGNWQVGGGFSVGHSSETGTDVNLFPSARYFVNHRTAIGVQLRYRHNNFLTLTGAGPTFQYFFWKKHPWAGHVAQNFIFTQTDYTDGTSTSVPSATTAVGISYFIQRGTSLGLSLNYNIVSSDAGDLSQSVVLRSNIAFYF